MLFEAVVRTSVVNVVSSARDALAELNAYIMIPLVDCLTIIGIGLRSFVYFPGNVLRLSHSILDLVTVLRHVERIEAKVVIVITHGVARLE